MAEVTICSDFGAPKIKSAAGSTVSPSICREVYRALWKFFSALFLLQDSGWPTQKEEQQQLCCTTKWISYMYTYIPLFFLPTWSPLSSSRFSVVTYLIPRINDETLLSS